MKKLFLCILIAAAAAAAGCADKENKSVGDKPEITSASSAETTDVENIEDDTYAPLATVRDRKIISSENFEYEIYEGAVIITKYKGTESAVEIPAEIDGTPVNEVGFYAFEANTDITSVTLPQSVTVIGEGAFSGCSSLSAINLPEGLTKIEGGAFAGCESITGITVPSAVQRIQEGAFAYCTGMTSLTILSPELKYENWGLEELSGLTIYAPDGSAAAEWAGAMGKYAVC